MRGDKIVGFAYEVATWHAPRAGGVSLRCISRRWRCRSSGCSRSPLAGLIDLLAPAGPRLHVRRRVRQSLRLCPARAGVSGVVRKVDARRREADAAAADDQGRVHRRHLLVSARSHSSNCPTAREMTLSRPGPRDRRVARQRRRDDAAADSRLAAATSWSITRRRKACPATRKSSTGRRDLDLEIWKALEVPPEIIQASLERQRLQRPVDSVRRRPLGRASRTGRADPLRRSRHPAAHRPAQLRPRRQYEIRPKSLVETYSRDVWRQSERCQRFKVQRCNG